MDDKGEVWRQLKGRQPTNTRQRESNEDNHLHCINYNMYL